VTNKVIPILQFRDSLNEISPSFCAAKWNQVTLHLQTGHTHSCHHPRVHKIPLEEIANNPSALHNTSYKKLQRKKMLEGERPAECDYCWRIEDSSPDAISDRTFKSNESWAKPYIPSIQALPWDQDVLPTYLEVSFSSVCNLKCSYCSPQFSSKWMEEIERHGPYPTSTKFGNVEWLQQTNAMPIPHKDENPYVDAFWKWWPDIYTTLEHFRITGGEPLMTKDTFKVLDYIIDNPNPKLELSINSNMCVPDSLIDKFIEKIKIIVNENKVKKFKIFTSCDAAGSQAEYIRDGLNYSKWISNIERVLAEVPGCTFTVMCTYNALSIFSFGQLANDILNIKLKYTTKETKHSPIMIDIPYLRYPEHQSIFILPKELLSLIAADIAFMEANVEDSHTAPFMGFFKFEVDKLRRVHDLAMNTENHADLRTHRRDFVKFVNEHDIRRGTDFLKDFPGFTNVYTEWSLL
jgi:organic radical activating enzyme